MTAISAVGHAAAADERYTQTQGQIFLSGLQALVRLTIVQRWRDSAQGLRTAGFVSGYRGSPLSALDEAFVAAATELERNDVHFQPGINEDLAATAVWGTQQVDLVGHSRVDGVYGMWYGKSPGVDRCGDVFKHANNAGTSRHGGVLLVAGDDHGAYSSTLANQSDQTFSACMIPWLYPCNVEEYIELGLHGWAMSRFSGCLIGFKALADTVESSASIDADPMRVTIAWPDDDAPYPPGGRHARLRAEPLGVQARQQESLLHEHKIQAALVYARLNRLNRVTLESSAARFGIIASGKSYSDTLEALSQLGIDEQMADVIGLRLFKVSMPWPLDPDSLESFALGLEEVLVIEEKRPVVETQVKELLYNLPVRPRIVGKLAVVDGEIKPLLPEVGDFSVDQLVRVISQRLAPFHSSPFIGQRLADLRSGEQYLHGLAVLEARSAYYCSGCPHNTSTRTPPGSVALAGIGCHVMATSIYPESNRTSTHMGAEGVPWIGQSRFSDRAHVFANLGDGTYFHSGHLAIRAAVAANVNITYKILYNDAVAMTGGQPVDGQLDVSAIARQVAAEGVRRIAIVSEDPERYERRLGIPRQVTLHGRDQFDAVQRELRDVHGVSVLIYDQTCAAEKRRRRRNGSLPEASKRLFINEAVCEGCGECGIRSNCTSLIPVQTNAGRKRQIDQASCNMDFSCADAYCPSFVSVVGARLRRQSIDGEVLSARFPLPHSPTQRDRIGRYDILVAGVGGSGVVTLGAWLGTAAHLEGKNVCVLDMTGMSQKNGGVTSHVRIADAELSIAAQRIPVGEADLVIGCDMLVTASLDVLRRMRGGVTHAVINTHPQPTGRFAQMPDWQFPDDQIRQRIDGALNATAQYLDFNRLAKAILGDTLAANALLLGYCWQCGLVPLREESLLNAIERCGVAPLLNRQAFAWGRRIQAHPAAVRDLLDPPAPIRIHFPERASAIASIHAKQLADYQGEAYAKQYLEFIELVRLHTSLLGARGDELVRAVGDGLFKLMAYKDEYEIARLYTSADFKQRLSEVFVGPFTLRLHLALPWLRRGGGSAAGSKGEYGAWIWPALRLLARLKVLRGTPLDPFGWQVERRTERGLIKWYRGAITDILPKVIAENLEVAVEIAKLPERIRGFGHVKAVSIEQAHQRLNKLHSELLR